ncbi:MAG: 3-deoxy-D-manno-octulosonic acid transferase [Sedimentitalea sp.]
MSRSRRLATDRALTERAATSDAPRPSSNRRAQQPVIWVHASREQHILALDDFALRLKLTVPDVRVVITYEAIVTAPELETTLRGADDLVLLDSDQMTSAQQFLLDWRPSLCIWAGGVLMPNLITATHDAGVYLVLIDVSSADFPTRRARWFPDLTQRSLACFDAVMTNNDSAATALTRLGISASKITVGTRLRNSATPPGCSDDELSGITSDLSGRPVWLAARTRPEEGPAILTAHRAALRLSHRLLLILTSDTPEQGRMMKQHVADSELRFADWDMGELIEDNTQVLLSASAEDLGLWYRVAPLTFMANSLAPGARGAPPLDAAALGSAIVFGPKIADHRETYSRLAAAGAARAVDDEVGLGTALVQLIAPDRAAAMALAGWELATDGAELVDRLVDLVQDHLDNEAGSDAPA